MYIRYIGLLSGSWKTSLPAPCWRPYGRVRLGLSPATERGPLTDTDAAAAIAYRPFVLRSAGPGESGGSRTRPQNVVPGSRNPTKHHRSHGSMQKQWGTLLQARAGTLFTHWRRSPQWKRRIIFILYSRGSGKGSLRGLVNSSTKGVLLATDWWVRVRGEGLSCPPLIGSLSFFLFTFPFLSSGGGFTQNGGAILKWSLLGFTFHTGSSWFMYCWSLACPRY